MALKEVDEDVDPHDDCAASDEAPGRSIVAGPLDAPRMRCEVAGGPEYCGSRIPDGTWRGYARLPPVSVGPRDAGIIGFGEPRNLASLSSVRPGGLCPSPTRNTLQTYKPV